MAKRTYEEINQRISRGEAVVMTAEEVAVMAETAGPEEVAAEVDVVTTGTFAPMCSSGAVLNFGHCSPPIRMEQVSLNGVSAHAGLAAVDCYLGATAAGPAAEYGGAHVIEDLVSGKEVRLEAHSAGTDCYPRTHLQQTVTSESMSDMLLFNPRNCYQNYAAATNSSAGRLSTYMGRLLPRMANVTYSTAGELSPLLNSPKLRTIGIGTPVFLCGARGYVVSSGTQSTDEVAVNDSGLPIRGAATLAVVGDMRQMDRRWLRAARFPDYGITLFVGLGIPIPVLDEEIARAVSIRNEDIDVEVVDYGNPGRPAVSRTSYAHLRSGWIRMGPRRIRTSSLSSLRRARQLADGLRQLILRGEFALMPPVDPLPSHSSRTGSGVESSCLPRGSAGWVRQGALIWSSSDCVHCGACTAPCTSGARRLDERTAGMTFNADLCSGCMECAENCPLDSLRAAGGGSDDRKSQDLPDSVR